MINLNLFLAELARSANWTPNVGIVMIICNLIAITIGFYAIQQRSKGPSLPALPGLFQGFNLPELLATMSFGHILGIGTILGLTNAGIL